MTKITKRAVDALKPGKADRIVWDSELPGFGVRCRPSGKRYYVLKYRTRGGRQRWHTIGQHCDALPPGKARAIAVRLRAAIQDGADPSGAKKQKRLENTVSELTDRYLAEHVKAHNKPRTAAEVERIVKKRIKPHLGLHKITDLSRADIKAWHQGMSATPYEANRALAYCSKMMSLAVKEWELRSDNPCIGIKRFPERARERYFTDAELRAIGDALAEMEREGTAPRGFGLLVRLLATTGMRLSEALDLTWDDVDLSHRAIRLQDAKAGARTVTLGAAAVTILDKLTDREGYVVNGGAQTYPISINVAEKAWGTLREKAGIPDGRLHDLRHTVGTFAALSGANAFAVRDLLGLRTLAMTGRYVERAAELVRATTDAVSNRVGAALNAGNRPKAKITRFRTRSA